MERKCWIFAKIRSFGAEKSLLIGMLIMPIVFTIRAIVLSITDDDFFNDGFLMPIFALLLLYGFCFLILFIAYFIFGMITVYIRDYHKVVFTEQYNDIIDKIDELLKDNSVENIKTRLRKIKFDIEVLGYDLDLPSNYTSQNTDLIKEDNKSVAGVILFLIILHSIYLLMWMFRN